MTKGFPENIFSRRAVSLYKSIRFSNFVDLFPHSARDVTKINSHDINVAYKKKLGMLHPSKCSANFSQKICYIQCQ